MLTEKTKIIFDSTVVCCWSTKYDVINYSQRSKSGCHSNGVDIYCNISDTCYIRCKSSQACTNVRFHCFEVGTCFVDCDADNGIDCPYVGVYDEWNTNDPTTIPTTQPTQYPSRNPSTIPSMLPSQLH